MRELSIKINKSHSWDIWDSGGPIWKNLTIEQATYIYQYLSEHDYKYLAKSDIKFANCDGSNGILAVNHLDKAWHGRSYYGIVFRPDYGTTGKFVGCYLYHYEFSIL